MYLINDTFSWQNLPYKIKYEYAQLCISQKSFPIFGCQIWRKALTVWLTFATYGSTFFSEIFPTNYTTPPLGLQNEQLKVTIAESFYCIHGNHVRGMSLSSIHYANRT